MKTKRQHFYAARQSRKQVTAINPRPRGQGRAASFTTTSAAAPKANGKAIQTNAARVRAAKDRQSKRTRHQTRISKEVRSRSL